MVVIHFFKILFTSFFFRFFICETVIYYCNLVLVWVRWAKCFVFVHDHVFVVGLECELCEFEESNMYLRAIITCMWNKSIQQHEQKRFFFRCFVSLLNFLVDCECCPDVRFLNVSILGFFSGHTMSCVL